MTPSFWATEGPNCLFLAALFYSIVFIGWLNERWKERHPGWSARLPGDHRSHAGVVRLRDEPREGWGRKLTEGEVEYL